jgi:hypothetical protein
VNTRDPGVHKEQESAVQALPSLQSAFVLQQPAICVWLQPVAGSQESAVQALLSSQLAGLPPAQAPD